MQLPRFLAVALPTLIIGLLSVANPAHASTTAATLYEQENPGEEVYFFLDDHLGSVDVVLDDKGNVVERRDFLPYGEERASEQTEVTPKTPQKFTGKELDDETGLYYYGARYYDPVIGRFTSVDPAILGNTAKPLSSFLNAPQSLNAYTYAANNPLRFIDPLGLWNQETGAVEKGDTLTKIVKTINKLFDTAYKISEIANLNNIKDPNKIYVGQKIIPNVDVPEITKPLQEEMHKDAKDKYINNLFYFKAKFKTKGDWDLKSREGSIFNTKEQGKEGFVFSGEWVRNDFPGNALYGYVGKATRWAWEKLLLWGAGREQKRVGNSTKEWQKNGTGDDPSDELFIRKGFELYETGF